MLLTVLDLVPWIDIGLRIFPAQQKSVPYFFAEVSQIYFSHTKAWNMKKIKLPYARHFGCLITKKNEKLRLIILKNILNFVLRRQKYQCSQFNLKNIWNRDVKCEKLKSILTYLRVHIRTKNKILTFIIFLIKIAFFH